MTPQELKALKAKWQRAELWFIPYAEYKDAPADIAILIEALEAMLEIEKIDVAVIEALTKQRDTLQEELHRVRKLLSETL